MRRQRRRPFWAVPYRTRPAPVHRATLASLPPRGAPAWQATRLAAARVGLALRRARVGAAPSRACLAGSGRQFLTRSTRDRSDHAPGLLRPGLGSPARLAPIDSP